jgi:Domain of unknown function (DUF4279)
MRKEVEIKPELAQQFFNISLKEFKEKNWGITEQYLEVMEILTEDGLPVIAKIEKSESEYLVYFTVKGEKFYYTHYFEGVNPPQLIAIDITPCTEVYLSVYSDEMNAEEMMAFTTLCTRKIYNKGDLRGTGKNMEAIRKQSRFDFEPGLNKAGAFENKLIFLLDQLESHKSELDKLKSLGCQMSVSALMNAYISNTMVGGFFLDKTIIKKLNDLELELSFDLVVSGNLLNRQSVNK